ncbi:hypothetical protein GCM10027347_53640 [Larkinella harenae]
METSFTIIGIGPAGVQVLDHLTDRGLPDLTAVACLSDLNSLQASRIREKILLPLNASDTHWTESLSPLVKTAKLVFVIAQVHDEATLQTVLATARFLQAVDQPCIGVLALSQAIDSTLSAPISSLADICQGLLVFEAPKRSHEYLLSQLTVALEGILDICTQTLGSVDYYDVRHVLRGRGRAAVVRQQAAGTNRSEELLSKVLDQLTVENFDASRVNRVLLQLSSSPEYPTLMREQVTITKGFTALFTAPANVFKVGYATDPSLNSTLQLTLLLWAPLE